MSPTTSYVKLALFEAAVLYHPPVRLKDGEEVEERRTQLVLEPTTFLARDQEHAAMLAARAIDAKYEDELDRCEVVVRPF